MKIKTITPSLFTMGNMLMGFIAIIYAAQYSPAMGNIFNLYVAGFLIFVAGIFDLSDGAVARALGVESEIGMQLDSLADSVAYGLAPGVLAYQSYFYQLPEIFPGFSSGIVVAAVFPVCTVFRLARFNCEPGNGKGFTGLPSPAGGMVVAIVPALFTATDTVFGQIEFVMPLYYYVAFYVFVAYLMVSEIDYSKLFSNIWRKGNVVRIVTLVAIILLLVFFGAWSIFVCISLYIIWGVVRYLVRLVA